MLVLDGCGKSNSSIDNAGKSAIGAYLYMNQQISLPILVACIIIPIGAIAPLMKLASAGEMLTTITANLKPVKDFLATPEQKRPGCES